MLVFPNSSVIGGRRHAAALWVCVAALLWPADATRAQGLLDFIFGGAKPAAAPIPISPQMRTLPKPGGGGIFQAEPKRAESDGGGDGRGTYRTVCVRMCDGFFVPMSFATTRANFAQDQMKCQATCGGDARLFYHRNPGGGMDEAVDTTGRVYGRLPNAFRFRKTLVEGCSCRPPPWSEAELARHRSYASGPQSPVAGQPLSPSTKVADAQRTQDRTLARDERAEAGVHSETQTAAAPPVLKPAKARAATPPVRAPGESPRVVRTAGSATVPVLKPVVPKASGGLFGFGGGSGSGMGLSGKPKYAWPGD